MESQGRGVSTVRSWEEIRKSTGVAPPLEDIREMLRSDENMMLRREELENILYDYFDSKIQVVEDEDTGELVSVWKSAPTKSELAARLGITTETLGRYSRGVYGGGRTYQGLTRERVAPEDFDLIRKALLIISDFYEKKLSENRNNSGTIFWLLNSQNNRWSNDQTLELKTDADTWRKPQRTPEEIAAQYMEYAEINMEGDL